MIKKLFTSNLFLFTICVAAGLLLSLFAAQFSMDIRSLELSTFTYALLAIGLYGGVYAIPHDELTNNKRMVLSAITIGVVLKTCIIGGLLYAVTGHVVSFLFAVIIAQIDPVSVTHLLKVSTKPRLSKQGETVLRAWSSFDDPMTVLLSLYLILPLVMASLSSGQAMFDFTTYLVELGMNVGMAGAAFVVWRLFKSHFNKHQGVMMGWLLLLFVLAISYKLMLAIAIIGLFIRPNIEKVLHHLVSGAFFLSTILLGALLIDGISPKTGVLLGLFAVLSQMIAAWCLARDFSVKDKLFLGCGQQNGITSIILSILIEGFVPGTIAVTAPAIFSINAIYYGLNWALDRVYQSK